MDARAEVLRYLGYRGQEMSADMSARIDAAIGECRAVSRPRFVYRRFAVKHEDCGIHIGGTDVCLAGEMAAERLRGAEGVFVLAATLGAEIEARIRRAQYSDMPYALMLDAAADWLIEDTCDKACAEMSRESGTPAGGRFSPGYGDLPLELQPRLLSLTDAGKRIGLSSADNHILTPRKSVTAIIPITNHVSRSGNCEECAMSATCPFSTCTFPGKPQ